MSGVVEFFGFTGEAKAPRVGPRHARRRSITMSTVCVIGFLLLGVAGLAVAVFLLLLVGGE